MFLLCLAAVLAVSARCVAEQSCFFKYTPDSFISHGEETLLIHGLEYCQMFCLSMPDCQGFDFLPFSGVCWWLRTQSGLQPTQGMDHYDKICKDNDVVSSPGNPLCFKTNYQGPVTELWTAPDGVNWNFQIAHFGFDWPQSGVLSLPLSSLVFFDSISFKSFDNLDYFRVVITQNNGKTITTQAIGPNDKSITLSGANDVKRVDFYLASVDFRRNVSLTDVNLIACTGTGILRDCTIFSLVRDQILTASLGIIKPGGTSGTFSASVAPEYPFVELDLNCAGYGTVTFTNVIFERAQKVQFVKINVWVGDTVVTIPEGDTFSDAQNISFASIVRGNRIRSTIIPSGVSGQGISGSIEFLQYSILAS